MSLISELACWLREEEAERLKELFAAADTVRAKNVGDEVHLRGLIEFSNFCVRACLYCGLRAGNSRLPRYRMNQEEILAAAEEAQARGYGTVVLQSGEDDGISASWLAEVISAIKARTSLAVTLSVGERPLSDYQLWREKGADRYLLKFETSDQALLHRLHPPRRNGPVDRINLLKEMKKIGYQIGGGIMVGLPGQTYASLLRDLELFGELDLDMIGIGPYIPHPDTPLANKPEDFTVSQKEQVPATELMTLKMVALARLVCPEAHIPATTALATLDPAGYEKALRAGANVIMPNLTPLKYRQLYEIYPDSISRRGDDLHTMILSAIRRAGREVGTGPGHRERKS